MPELLWACRDWPERYEGMVQLDELWFVEP